MTNETELEPTPPEVRPPSSRFARIALGVALLAALVAAMAGFGSRWGIWDFRTGFSMLRWGAYGGVAAIVLGAIAAFRTRPSRSRRGFAVALLALAIGLVVFAIPWQASRAGRGLPPIHDITTDVNDPPAFVAIAPLRADAPNPVEYGGEEVARQQIAAYPDIQPLLLNMSSDRAFQRVLDVVQGKGWNVVDANLAEGRIEATDRTFWFGFYDDVVVRLTPVGERTIVDVRSKSRVGRGDTGTNARRVRALLRDIAE